MPRVWVLAIVALNLVLGVVSGAAPLKVTEHETGGGGGGGFENAAGATFDQEPAEDAVVARSRRLDGFSSDTDDVGGARLDVPRIFDVRVPGLGGFADVDVAEGVDQVQGGVAAAAPPALGLGEDDTTLVTVSKSALNFGAPYGEGDGILEQTTRFTGTLDAVNTGVNGLIASVPSATVSGADGTELLTVSLNDLSNTGVGQKEEVSHSFALGLRAGAIPRVTCLVPSSGDVGGGGVVTARLANYGLPTHSNHNYRCCFVVVHNQAADNGTEAATSSSSSSTTTECEDALYTSSTGSNVTCAQPAVPGVEDPATATEPTLAAFYLESPAAFTTNQVQFLFTPVESLPQLPAVASNSSESGTPSTDSSATAPTVLSVAPISAPTSGGTLLRVVTTSLETLFDQSLWCVLTLGTSGVTLTTPVAFVDGDDRNTTVTCLTPPVTVQGFVGLASLQLATDVSGTSAVSAGVKLLYRLPRVVVSVSPSSAVLGTSGPLDVQGYDIAYSSTLACAFVVVVPSSGVYPDTTDTLVTVATTSATWLTTETASCTLPTIEFDSVSAAQAGISEGGLPLSVLVMLVEESTGLEDDGPDGVGLGGSLVLVSSDDASADDDGSSSSSSSSSSEAPLSPSSSGNGSAVVALQPASFSPGVLQVTVSPDVAVPDVGSSTGEDIVDDGECLAPTDLAQQQPSLTPGLDEANAVADRITVQFLDPGLGPVDGGTALSISGTGFLLATDSSLLLCVFSGTVERLQPDGVTVLTVSNTVSTPATALSDSTLVCSTPVWDSGTSRLANGMVHVGVTYNGVDVVGSGLQFLFHTTTTVSSVSPTSGSEDGGTDVVVAGTGFAWSQSLTCLFGGVAAASVQWVSESTIVCTTPSGLDPALVEVQVTTNGQQVTTSSTSALFQVLTRADARAFGLTSDDGGSSFGADGLSVSSATTTTLSTSSSSSSSSSSSTTTTSASSGTDSASSSSSETTCPFGEVDVSGGCRFADTPLPGNTDAVDLTASATASTDASAAQSDATVVSTDTTDSVVPVAALEYTPAWPDPVGSGLDLGFDKVPLTSVPLTVAASSSDDTSSSSSSSSSSSDTCDAGEEVLPADETFDIFLPDPAVESAPVSTEEWTDFTNPEAPTPESIAGDTSVLQAPDLRQPEAPVPDGPSSDVYEPWANDLATPVSPNGLEGLDDTVADPAGGCQWVTLDAEPEDTTATLFFFRCTSDDPRPVPAAPSTVPGFPDPLDGQPEPADPLDAPFSFTFAEVETPVYPVPAPDVELEPLAVAAASPSPEPPTSPAFGWADDTTPFEQPIPDGPDVSTTEYYDPPTSPVVLTDTQIVANEEARLQAEVEAAEAVFGASPIPPEEDAVPLIVPSRDVLAGPTDTAVMFESTVSAATPLRGPTRGDTLVTLSGTRLLPRNDLGFPVLGDLVPFCEFGSLEVAAEVLDADTLQCRSPRVEEPSTVPLSVVFRKPHTRFWTRADGPALEFEFYLPPVVRQLRPASGRVVGGTRVAVVGRHFTEGHTTVRFSCGGSDAASSVVVIPDFLAALPSAEQEAIVFAPPSPCGSGSAGTTTGFATVEVSNNGADFTTNGVLFAYDATVTVSALSPAFGADVGGTDVWVVGDNFLESPSLHCRFGGVLPLVPATFMSSTTIRCESPAVLFHEAHPIPRQVPVEVTNNGIEFSTSGVMFSYAHMPFIVDIEPDWGTATGGDLVVVTGTGFLDTPSLLCLWGDQLGDTLPPIPALFQSSTEIVCRSPPIVVNTAHPIPRSLSLEVTNNGADYTAEGFTFEFREFIDVQAIWPRWGPAEGGTLVTVAGTLFLNSPALHCRFGAFPPEPATWLSPTTLQCRAPTVVSPTPGSPFSVAVEVSNDAIDYTESGVQFRFGDVPSVDPPGPGTLPVDEALQVDPNFLVSARGPGFFPETFGPEFLPNRNPLTFYYDSEVEVAATFPTWGPLSGNKPVVVTGSGFNASSPALQCRWGSRCWTDGVVVTDTTILCATPRGEAPGTVDVSVTNNGIDHSLTSAQYTFYPDITFASIDPVRGPVAGGTDTVLHGTGFLPTTRLFCKFGTEIVPATWETGERLRCTTPAQAGDGPVTVRVTNNDQDYSLASLTYTYDADAVVTAVDPISGPTSGNTMVVVTGVGFLQSANHFCLFGDLPETRATLVNETTLLCRSPASRAPPGNVLVSVKQFSFFDQSASFSQSVANYSFEDPVVIDRFVPQSGPLTGGTVISVYGSGFVDHTDRGTLMCRFQTGHERPATFVSSSLVLCVTPPFDLLTYPASTWLDVRPVTLEIANNNQDFTAGHTLFYYEPPPRVDTLHPTTGPSGGATVVTVFGEFFVNTSRLVCMFGDKPSFQALYIDSETVQCVTPAHTAAEAAPENSTANTNATVVQVRISNNDQQFTGTEAFLPVLDSADLADGAVGGQVPLPGSVPLADLGLPFSYEDPVVTHLEPFRGSLLGLTRVHVFGGPWTTAFMAGIKCKFGDHVGVLAEWVSDTELVCVSPALSDVAALDAATESVFVPLEVTINDQDFTTTAVQYEYHPEVRIERLYPDHGPVLGNTLVQLFGAGYTNYSAGSKCRFGATEVFAEYVSPGEMRCETPQVDPDLFDVLGTTTSVDVELTFNDKDYTFTGIQYTYQPVARVARLYPNRGPETGGTRIRLVGDNFHNHTEGIRCRFGTVIVPAVWHTPTELQCTTPALPVEDVDPAENNSTFVDVEVTFNNQNYTRSEIKFEYQPTVRVFGLSPHHGPVNGGTEVVVFGQHFVDTSQLYCMFGDGDDRARESVPVTAFLNTTHVVCVAPPALRPGPVNVTVSNNANAHNSNFSSSSYDVIGNVRYTYDAPIVIDSFSPSLGRTSGNFSVHVLGANFLPTLELRCRFGSVVTQGVWLDDSSLYCIAPAHLEGRVPLEVTNNDQDWTFAQVPFRYVEDTVVTKIIPVSGPSDTAGNRVTVYGRHFVNSSLLACRFENETVPARFVSPTELECWPRPHPYWLTWRSLQRFVNEVPDPTTGSRQLFPTAYHYPWFESYPVDVDVTVNGQDYTRSGVRYVFQRDPVVDRVYPESARDTSNTVLWVFGQNFVNSTTTRCRIGNAVVNTTFMSPTLLLCLTPQQSVFEPDHGQWRHGRQGFDDPNFSFATKARTRAAPGSLFVEVTNNGLDYTHDRVVFTQLPPCPSGYFCPKYDDDAILECPRGSYCPGVGNTNFTLCPVGMYQPARAQSVCLRCPVGYMCPEEGLPIPRICPAGFVCDVTGTQHAEQPCPEGHFCLEGTATTATTCGNPHRPSSRLYPRQSLAERETTVRLNQQRAGNKWILGARNTACWDNSTTDFGFHDYRDFPARYWVEAHQLPLSATSPFSPRRGRYCLDDSCVRLADEGEMALSDPHFDYASQDFALRRPVPCPPGMFCHPGTAVNVTNQRNYTTPQPCFESMYCPEGSETPRGMGACPPGFYCPFGTRIPCPVGTRCPDEGSWDPRPCPPGTFNGQVGQLTCTTCPVGFICPGFGRVDPAICPPGFVCTLSGQDTPDSICPAGFYCNNGTLTSDPFRNDTTLRPYPCRPGTYCTKGVGFSQVVSLDFKYAQFCTEGFYCESASATPIGNGLCPRGFVCPTGTAIPVPTEPGTFAELEGTVAAADCLPGFYAPTIETVSCYPCPPGTQCENDGTAEASICPPGTYRSIVEVDGIVCAGCPQGTWSKNWEIRDVRECTRCPSGSFCPIDGMTNPCSFNDFPLPYTPLDPPDVARKTSLAECNSLGDAYFYGILQPPIDSDKKGPNLDLVEAEDVLAECYFNPQPDGSIIYNRFKETFGPLYELQTGRRHQGYGNDTYFGVFGKGSRFIDLPAVLLFEPGNNCTSGHFAKNDDTGVDQWYPGNCEADVFCQVNTRSEAQPCSEGFVCGQRTTSLTAQAVPCQGGYVCDFGTTPDIDLLAPNGKFKQLCPEGFICSDSTGTSQQFRSPCPLGYFCPTGTHDALLGKLAGDAFNREFTRDQADPFLFNTTLFIDSAPTDDLLTSTPGWLEPPHVRIPRQVSLHDQHCFDAIAASNQMNMVTVTDFKNRTFQASVAVLEAKECARDHKWRLMQDAVDRGMCFCSEQVTLVTEVYRLWKCTFADVRQCEFLSPLWARERDTTTGHTITEPVMFPSDPDLERRYLVNCGARKTTCEPLSSNDNEECPSFCSFADLKLWVEDRWASEIDRTDSLKLTGESVSIRPLIYDLKYAVDLLDTSRQLTDAVEPRPLGSDDEPWALGDEVLTYFNLVTSDTTGELVPSRMDMCQCEDALRCPNGTTTRDLGATSIRDCERTGQEVLHRISPIDATLLNTTVAGLTILTDVFQRGDRVSPIGVLELGALQQATLTMNLTDLSQNFTYGQHYQISIYDDCIPCPPRYKCDSLSLEPVCTSPSLAEQAEFGVLCADCCSCERHSMPEWFTEENPVFPYFDNKHVVITVQMTAVADTRLLVVLELVHARYINEFFNDLASLAIRAEMVVHNPERARNTPNEPDARYGFMAIIEQGNFDELSLPFNLPQRIRRTPGTTAGTYFDFESAVFIDRPADLFISHTAYTSQVARRARNNLTATTTGRRLDDEIVTGLHELLGEEGEEGEGEEEDHDDDDASGGARRRTRSRTLVVGRQGGYGPLSAHLDDSGDAGAARSLQEDESPSPAPSASPSPAASTAPGVSREPTSQDADISLDPLSRVQKDTTWWATADNNIEIFELGLPYLPFFSNCAGYDSHVFLSTLLEENPMCELVDFPVTIFVDQYPWGNQFTPLADTCELVGWSPSPDDDNEGQGVPGIPLACFYEESIYNPPPVNRWFELAEGDALFSLTKEPIHRLSFVANEEEETRWGRSDTIVGLAGTENVVDVEILSAGAETFVPRLVTLTVEYYQVTQRRKRIVQAAASFRDFCSISETVETLARLAARDPPVLPCAPNDYNYTLEVTLAPLEWLALLNLFEFTADVYVMLFIIIGFITTFIGFVVWLVHRVMSRLRPPPNFRFTKLWAIVTPSPSVGILLSTGPMFAILFTIMVWFISFGSSDPVLSPSSIAFEDVVGDWLDRQVLNEDRILHYKLGRIGSALIWTGFFAMVVGAKMFVPDDVDGKHADDNAEASDDRELDAELLLDNDAEEEAKAAPSPFWTPLFWKRSHMIFCAIIEILILMIILEFSYSHWFEDNQYLFIVTLKVLQMFFDLLLAAFLRENLLVSPLLVTIEVTEILITMGAEDFTDFVLAFFVEASITIAERIYLDPALKRLSSLIPKWKLSCARRCRKSRRLTKEQRLREEIEWRRINDEIQLESEGVEPLLDSFYVYSNETLALFLTPFLQLLLLATDASSFHDLQITKIPENYGIRPTDLIYYTIFSVVIIPAQLGMDMFLLNTQELVHGWKLFDYISYQRYRFTVRETRWQMSSTTLDESISEPMQTLDMMCFSAQYYFMSALFAWGMLFVQLGMTVHVRENYNMFGDISVGIIVIVCWFMIHLLKFICIRFANIIGLWRRKDYEGTVDDEVATKLAIGEGKQEDLEAERMELRALNSETFRHRFLDRSRPWILQHLTELLTPRTLQMPGADGRPNMEYIRDIYHDLKNMGEGMRQEDDRADISSDDGQDDYEELLRREWAKKPITKTSAALARLWLLKARKRQKYRKLVAATVENAKEDICGLCERTTAMGAVMRVDLAKDNKPYPNAIDELIQGFEKEQGEGADLDPALWKAYFRKNAVFITRCDTCSDMLKQAQMAARHQPKADRGPARAVDISSDEEDFGPSFKPMVVSRSTSEAKVLSKWLTAARKRLGGVFPRPHAADEMEAHARRLREARAEKARKALKRQQRRERAELTGQWDEAKDGPRFAKFRANAATKALAKLWLQNGQRSLLRRRRQKANKLRDEVGTTLEQLTPEDDWYYGKEVRLKGAELLRQGEKLLVERTTMENEEDEAVKELREGQKKFEAAKERERVALSREVEKNVEVFREATKKETDERVGELTATRRDRELEFAQVEAAAEPKQRAGLQAMHKEQLEGLTLNIQAVKERRQKTITAKQHELQSDLRSQEMLIESAINDRREAMNRRIRAIKTEYGHKIRLAAESWTLAAHEWVGSTKRKVRSKAREAALDAKSP